MSFPRRHPAWTALIGIVAVLAVLLALFNWNWVRPPIERYISKQTGREFHAASLDVKLGMNPTIRLDRLVFANAPWGDRRPMAQVGKLEFQVSLRDLFEGRVLVPRAALTDADLLFERAADGSKTWTLSDPSDKSPSRLRISSLSVNNGHLRYLDHGMPFDLDIVADTFDPALQDKVKSADAKPVNQRYAAQYRFTGKYHDASFSGTALTGEVLSFQESNVPFPIKGSLAAGTTHLDVEGSVADAANITGIDVNLHVAGQTLANIYPFLLLPLPASPPYQLSGHLVLKGDRYTLEQLTGQIGSTDVHGSAGYAQKKPRPLLTANLHSDTINLSDLGPLIGVKTEPAKGKPRTTQAETNTRAQAVQAEAVRDEDRVLPAGSFDGSRLQAIDADVDLETRHLKAPVSLPVESLRASLHLHDAILKLTPLDVGFAGGDILSQITLDARQPVIRSQADVDFRRLRLDQLFPQKPQIAKAAGTMGARINITGTGNSIADTAAKANGSISAAIANGRISNLIDAASGLNGGKVLTLLAGGYRDIQVRCGGAAFDVKNGQGRSTLFLIDTEQTQITGDGSFDLAHERFDLTVAPKPKKPAILSLRTPIRVFGTFRKPDYALEKGPLMARAGAALALAVLNPLAVLLPLVEPGPGVDSDCAQVLGVTQDARHEAAPKGTGDRKAPAAPGKAPGSPPPSSGAAVAGSRPARAATTPEEGA